MVVPYLDLDAMTSALLQLINDKNLREKLGKNARNKAIEQHDVAVSSRKIVDVIDRVVDKNRKIKSYSSSRVQ